MDRPFSTGSKILAKRLLSCARYKVSTTLSRLILCSRSTELELMELETSARKIRW